ncbi:hypothetical protein RDI58_007497 [Solanum bulbocastanum]|uniref:Uncharacterized protein n=1 Tax=Solanum bulbocastanum TaxID=147425 RepID=A0AAN8TWJ1_SOLBU
MGSMNHISSQVTTEKETEPFSKHGQEASCTVHTISRTRSGNAIQELAKIVHSRGFYVTFVNTEYNYRHLIRSQGPDFVKGFQDFQFETISEGLPQSDRDVTQDPASLCDSIRKNCLTHFRDLLSKHGSSPVAPPISCIIADGLMSFAIKAAQEYGILDVQFWTTSACGYMGYLQYDELRGRGIIPFKDDSFMDDGTLDRVVDGIPGMRNIRFKDYQALS